MIFRKIVLIGLCLSQTILLLILSWQTSLNRTEVGHLGAAVYFYHTGQFDVFHVNPPLTRIISGGPILLAAPSFDWKTYSPRPQDRSEWSIGKSFIQANTPVQIRWATFWARCSLIPLILLGSGFGYRFASELYGTGAGLMFVVLWTFSPLVLAWGATICPDVTASSLGIMAVYAFWHWLKKPTWKQTVLAGLALGLLPLAKITWIIAFPLWIVIWLCWLLLSKSLPAPKPDGKRMVVLLGIALYLLHTGYLFDGSFRPLGEYEFISRTFSGTDTPPGNRFTGSWSASLPVPLPGEFLQGIDTQKLDFERGIESYFRGTYSQHGWWYYYLYTVLVKEPLAILILGGLALTVSFRRSPDNAGATRRDEMVVLFPGLTVFVLVSSQTGFSLHPRYIIPALPFAYIGISQLARSFPERRYVLATVTTLLLVWLAGSSLSAFPHAMSYFNETIGGSKNGPKYLLGSNIDWGQNSYFLKTWYDTHPEARPIRIAYTPTESFERLGIPDVAIPSGDPEPGWYAIGANELYGPGDLYEAFRSLEPVDRIGTSIWIYHIEPEAAP